MNYKEREELFSDIDNFNSGDLVSCQCSTSNPPCSWCTHPGNLNYCEDKEITKMVEMRDVLGDSDFYPEDKVYTDADLKAILVCVYKRYDKPKPKIVESVSINKDGDMCAKLSNDSNVPFSSLYHSDQAKKEITKMLANGIVTIQTWEL